jgi:hypothetical protein
MNYITSLINILVPDKREKVNISFLSSPVAEIQVVNDTLFTVYEKGLNFNLWDISTTYNRNDVIGYGKQVYFSVIDDNTGNNPNSTDNWCKISNNFIGADTRVHFNGTKLIFEYAINTYFNTFYQPNTTLNSEIYTETFSIKPKTFYVALSEPFSDTIGKTNSSGYIPLTEGSGTDIQLIIWVLGLDTPDKPSKIDVNKFASQYIVAGVKYDIRGY